LGERNLPEILLADAVVARATGAQHGQPLDNADLPAALPNKSGQ